MKVDFHSRAVSPDTTHRVPLQPNLNLTTSHSSSVTVIAKTQIELTAGATIQTFAYLHVDNYNNAFIN